MGILVGIRSYTVFPKQPVFHCCSRCCCLLSSASQVQFIWNELLNFKPPSSSWETHRGRYATVLTGCACVLLSFMCKVLGGEVGGGWCPFSHNTQKCRIHFVRAHRGLRVPPWGFCVNVSKCTPLTPTPQCEITLQRTSDLIWDA